MTQTKIRVLDLAEPALSPEQKAAHAAADARTVEISVDSILAAAAKQAGVEDFGSDDFLERLQVQVDAVNADEGASNLGRLSVLRDLVRFTRNRLHIEDLIKRHPEILDMQLEPPILIAGLPRSGTTFLHQIMAADPRLRSNPYWEALRPVAEHYMVDGVDTRWQLAQDQWEAMDRMLPTLKAVHEFTPDHITEDIELSELDFGSYYLEWMCRAPSWRDYQEAHDMSGSYRYMEKVLKALSWQSGGSKRWVTKCPQHMERLSTLHSVFQNATFLINHRDPVASIQSAITAKAISSRLSRKRVDLDEIASYWIDRYERLLRACVAQRDCLPEGQVMDIYFHKLMADPRQTLRQAYQVIGLDYEPAAESIDRALSVNERGRHGQMQYDLRADFGLEPEQVRSRFEFYFERFPEVGIEVK
jgi:hypothetical protein